MFREDKFNPYYEKLVPADIDHRQEEKFKMIENKGEKNKDIIIRRYHFPADEEIKDEMDLFIRQTFENFTDEEIKKLFKELNAFGINTVGVDIERKEDEIFMIIERVYKKGEIVDHEQEVKALFVSILDYFVTKFKRKEPYLYDLLILNQFEYGHRSMEDEDSKIYLVDYDPVFIQTDESFNLVFSQLMKLYKSTILTKYLELIQSDEEVKQRVVELLSSVSENDFKSIHSISSDGANDFLFFNKAKKEIIEMLTDN
jgi:hypothetical protein